MRLGPQLIREEDSLKVLGVKFCKSWYLTVVTNYDSLIANIKTAMHKHKSRNLNLYERCIVLNTFILSKLWYLAQIFPPLNRHIAEIRKVCGNFIWNGFIFRVERNQLYLDYLKRGMKLIDPEAKVKALFIKNLLYNVDNDGNFIQENFLLEFRIPQRLTKNAREWISIAKDVHSRFQLNSTKLLYDYFVELNKCVPKIETKIDSDWTIVWENINHNFLTMNDRSKLFCFVNNLIPTGDKLSAYNIRKTPQLCAKCGVADNMGHRLKKCHGARVIWNLCCQVIRTRMGIIANDIEDILSHKISLRSQKQKSALWLTIRAISFNLKYPDSNLFVFKKQLRELRWNNRKKFAKEFGNCLNIC